MTGVGVAQIVQADLGGEVCLGAQHGPRCGDISQVACFARFRMEQMRVPPSAGLELCDCGASRRVEHDLTRSAFGIAQHQSGGFHVCPP